MIKRTRYVVSLLMSLLLICNVLYCVQISRAAVPKIILYKAQTDYLVFKQEHADSLYEWIEATEQGKSYATAFFSRKGCEVPSDTIDNICNYYKDMSGAVYYVVPINKGEDSRLERGKTYTFKFLREDEVENVQCVVESVKIPKYVGITSLSIGNSKGKLCVSFKTNITKVKGILLVHYEGKDKMYRVALKKGKTKYCVKIPKGLKKDIVRVYLDVVGKNLNTEDRRQVYEKGTYITRGKVERCKASYLKGFPFDEMYAELL